MIYVQTCMNTYIDMYIISRFLKKLGHLRPGSQKIEDYWKGLCLILSGAHLGIHFYGENFFSHIP